MDPEVEDEVMTARKKALQAIYDIRKPKKKSILERDPDDEELMAIRIIQNHIRGFLIRKNMKKLKLARCREMIVKNKYGLKTFSYGFVLKNEYLQNFRLTNIVDVTFNFKLGEVVIMDTRGVSTWKKSDWERAVTRPYVFEKYNSRYLRSLVYSQKMNVFYALAKDHSIKVINKEFEETFEVNAADSRAVYIILNVKHDQIWSVGPDGVKVWVLEKRPELNWSSVKSMINYWLQRKANYPDVARGWALTAFFDSSNEFFIACSESRVVVYNLKGEEIAMVSDCHMAAITGADISSENDLLITCSEDCTMKIWKQVQTRLKHVFTFRGGKKFTGLAIHPRDSSLALLSSEDGFIKLFSLDCFAEIQRLYICDSAIIKMIFTPDKYLIVATTRMCFYYHLNYHYKFWAPMRTPATDMQLLSADGKTTRLQVVGSDNSVRLISQIGTHNYSMILPPPNIPPTRKIIGVTCVREYNLMFVLLDEQIVWVYTVRTHPACHIDAWNLARHQEQLITQLLDGEQPETFIRFPVADDLNHPVTENAYGVLSVVHCTTIGYLNSKVRFYRKNVGYLYTEASIFVLVGLEDGRILFMDPLTSCKKHVDFRPSKHPVHTIRFHKDQNLLTVLSIDRVTKAFITVWQLPNVEKVREIRTENDCVCYSLVARTVMTGHSDGTLNIFLWNTSSKSEKASGGGGRNRFRKAVLKVMAVSSFRRFSKDDLEPDSDEDYVDLEKGQLKRKHKEHLGRVLTVQSNHYLQVFLTCGQEDHAIKIWSKSKTLLREICLDSTLTSASFVSDLGDIVFSYNTHLFYMSRKYVFPELKSILDPIEASSEVESYVHEMSELRFGAVAQHHKQDESLESYLMPFSLQESFYQSKESIVKWDQDGQRRIHFEDDGSSSASDTTFDSLRANSETYASIDSYAHSRYTNPSSSRPPLNLLENDSDNASTNSEGSDSQVSRKHAPRIFVDPLYKKMMIAAKFRLPTMVETPTPLSPILPEEKVVIEEVSEAEATLKDEEPTDSLAENEKEKVTSQEKSKQGQAEKKTQKLELKIEAPQPHRVVSPLVASTRTPLSAPAVFRVSKATTPVVSTPGPAPKTPIVPKMRKKSSGQRSSRVGAVNKQRRSAGSEGAKDNLPSGVSVESPSEETPPEDAPSSASNRERKKSAKSKIGMKPPPLPSVMLPEKDSREPTSVLSEFVDRETEIGSESQAGRSKMSSSQEQSVTDLSIAQDPMKVIVSAKNVNTQSKTEDAKGYRENIHRDARDMIDEKLVDSRVLRSKGPNFHQSEKYWDKAALMAEKNRQWVEGQLSKHEMKLKIQQERQEAVKNKQLQEMFKLWYKKQRIELDYQQSTSSEAFFKIVISDFLAHAIRNGEFVNKATLPPALQELLVNNLKQLEENSKLKANEKPSAESFEKRTGYRVPLLDDGTCSEFSERKSPSRRNSMFVDSAGAAVLLSAEMGSPHVANLSRAGSAAVHSRPVSRLCRSASSKIRTTKDREKDHEKTSNYQNRPKSAFETSGIVHRIRSARPERKQSSSSTRYERASRISSAKSIPSKCTDFILVRAESSNASCFDPPSRTEKSLLQKRFPHIYQQAVGASHGAYSSSS